MGHASEARTKLEAMLALAKSEGYLADAGQQWDSDPWLLGVANGVVDLRTGTAAAGPAEGPDHHAHRACPSSRRRRRRGG